MGARGGLPTFYREEKVWWYHHGDMSSNIIKGQKTRPLGDREDTKHVTEALMKRTGLHFTLFC